ncbi:hypothetical protein AX282_04470 [Bacillus spizizenii]|uniref:lactococcin 972 family bacteriocin n=1 Tax=Bacillus spizizenii TaxID=96241 RepID=UPI0007723756|nr:lactococcin 972 family bacteriocin [Bacillus spizizenii]KXJ36480.1 hypothetical protein AX282_04470 [Bacillus spizizenii]
MKKKVFASMVLGATLLVSSSVFASSSDDATHGEVKLDETKDLIKVMKLEMTRAGGGIWQYGFSDGKVISNYNHTKKTHKSSVKADLCNKVEKQRSGLHNRKIAKGF